MPEKRKSQKQIYYQEGFYTNQELVSLNKVHTLKTIDNYQTVTVKYMQHKQTERYSVG